MLVLIADGVPYLLGNIRRRENGLSGFVENGLWNFQLRERDGKKEILAKDGSYIVNRWYVENVEEIEVPETVKGGYEKIISWALGKRSEHH